MSVSKSVLVIAVAACACALGLTSPAAAINVAWVSFHPGDNQPSAAAANVGFTAAPDKGYTDLLEANGYNVTRYITTGNPDLNYLNKFDLVIISRSVASGDYQDDPETLAWNNGIYKPMMILGGYPIRNVRLGLTIGETIPDTLGAIKLSVNTPSHPIFNGVSLDAFNNMANDYTTGLAALPFEQNGVNTIQRGISVVTDSAITGANVLATVGSSTDVNDTTLGGMIIGDYESGLATGNDPIDFLGGHRLVFLTGSREHDGGVTGTASSGDIAGIYDLAPDGQKLFLNAVAYTANSNDYPADFNDDKVVNDADYQIIRDNFLFTGVTNANGDANFDGIVDVTDFRIWKNTQTVPGSAAAFEADLLASVPEPGSLMLFVAGMISWAASRRR